MNHDDPQFYKNVKDKMMDVLWSLRKALPTSDAKDIQTCVDDENYKDAFEMLVCVLCEDGIAVPSTSLNHLKWIGTAMGLNESMGMVKNLQVEFS
jgi:hypothetical protein